MTFNVFALRERVVGEYRDYFQSFVHIDDPQIAKFVQELLEEGEPWPDAVLQLNPAYEPGATLGELAARGVILPETARFFGSGLRLYRHQEEALAVAGRGEPYIVTTGTGSGKSLTYLIPIIDHVFRHKPERHSVRAIIVYPMNALINSQREALREFRDRNWPDCPVRFARYTGQEKEADRTEILNDPPHILLTNYVMLEYLLLRPYERSLVQQATGELDFLVVDELHVYRGRQGADVAMLLRRVRQKAAQPNLRFIGASATLSSEGSPQQRQARIAELGSTLFGVTVAPGNVIGETLRRVATSPAPSGEALRAAVLAPPPASHDPASVTTHPLAAWLEATFGLDQEEGKLVRGTPIAFTEGLEQLTRETGLERELCEERLKAVLEAGYAARSAGGDPLLAFRLHQFLASGSSVFATLEAPADRLLTTTGQYVAPDPDQGGRARLLYPLAFCRECGQEYYLVSRFQEGGHHLDDPGEAPDNVIRQLLAPRSPLLNFAEDEGTGEGGFFAIERDGLWSDQEQLPEYWVEELKSGPRIKGTYKVHEPRRYWALPDGTLCGEPVDGAIQGWFQPRPLMLCLRCRAAYDLRTRGDFAKLATLSQTGRSTATTIASSAAVTGLRQDEAVEVSARKVLSFTDNRQDASLQAGHLNDFVQVVLLRGALAQALERDGGFESDQVGFVAFKALELLPEEFLQEVVESGPGFQSGRATMIDLLQYRAFEDLRRAWRVAQPNLEQVGLLRIEYLGLAELAVDESLWAGLPAISEVSPERREAVLRALLDHLRRNLAIDVPCLREDDAKRLQQRAGRLREPWSIDEHEHLRTAHVALLPGMVAGHWERDTFGLGWRSAIGRYLHSRHTWGSDHTLDPKETDELVGLIVQRLRGHLLSVIKRDGEDWGVQIMAGALRWESGDGQAAGPDPVRSRSLHRRRQDVQRTAPNHYYQTLYRDRARLLKDVRGREHTGQTSAGERMEREREFREGSLAALFCSPTMELGVDISDLAVVHMRNVPPTPANYAQRSGRAGRGGKPALVLTFCSQGSAHDEHFFRNKTKMIAGAVSPARMDLANEELVRAHLHSVWLSETGLGLGNSMENLLELQTEGYPMREEITKQAQLSEPRQGSVIAAFWQVVGSADSSIAQAEWFSEEWLERTVRGAPADFNVALERWRDLYRSAIQQRNQARENIDRPRLPKDEKRQADKQEAEAKREIDLLLNQGDVTESDFYPYRYMAGEGFLPGYNFPRLPLRALVAGSGKTQSIDRPRFLGLSEFGPWNIIYHEGRQHRVTSCVAPPSGLELRLSRAKLCKCCGYIYPREQADQVDLCRCGAKLDGATSDFPGKLFEQPTVRTTRSTRITSDEEERSREGYLITTHYRFQPDRNRIQAEVRSSSQVADPEAPALLDVLYAPQAELWRINHGWRRSTHREGFTIDLETGRWAAAPDQEGKTDSIPDPRLRRPESGVKPYTTDHRNILLLRPIVETSGMVARSPAPRFLKTLAYALQRGIQFVYQIEEMEVQVELIGEGDAHARVPARLLLWEAAEGGTGVWERMLAEPHSFAEIAGEALRVCHFDPASGEPDPEWEGRCGIACYDCLLSYSNQREHRYLDRHLVRDYLLSLTSSKLVTPDTGDYEEKYRALCRSADPQSSLERSFLDYLYRRRLRLPDYAQHRPDENVPVQPDFHYQRDGRPGACIFVDGAPHDNPDSADQDRALREALEDRGYRVITIRYDQSLDEQVERHGDIFSPSVR